MIETRGQKKKKKDPLHSVHIRTQSSSTFILKTKTMNKKDRTFFLNAYFDTHRLQIKKKKKRKLLIYINEENDERRQKQIKLKSIERIRKWSYRS